MVLPRRLRELHDDELRSRLIVMRGSSLGREALGVTGVEVIGFGPEEVDGGVGGGVLTARLEGVGGRGARDRKGGRIALMRVVVDESTADC